MGGRISLGIQSHPTLQEHREALETPHPPQFVLAISVTFRHPDLIVDAVDNSTPSLRCAPRKDQRTQLPQGISARGASTLHTKDSLICHPAPFLVLKDLSWLRRSWKVSQGSLKQAVYFSCPTSAIHFIWILKRSVLASCHAKEKSWF